mmetsp:Transcript_14024/g.34733  ORF Transcript_14024/g.34733 Transcript_14024/m.34733 type:complete len:205 (-) Transcript_14024:5507-6121(-)
MFRSALICVECGFSICTQRRRVFSTSASSFRAYRPVPYTAPNEGKMFSSSTTFAIFLSTHGSFAFPSTRCRSVSALPSGPSCSVWFVPGAPCISWPETTWLSSVAWYMCELPSLLSTSVDDFSCVDVERSFDCVEGSVPGSAVGASFFFPPFFAPNPLAADAPSTPICAARRFRSSSAARSRCSRSFSIRPTTNSSRAACSLAR